MPLLPTGGRVDEKWSYNGLARSETPKDTGLPEPGPLDLIPLLERDRDGDKVKDSESFFQGTSRERHRNVSWLLQLLCAALGGAAIALLLRPSGSPAPSIIDLHGSERKPQYPAVEIPIATAPAQNLWKNVDIDEAVEIRDWLMDDKRGLNITRSHEAGESDNWIHLIESYAPSKSDAISYLSNITAAPPRYAHAFVHHGSNESIVDYLVGPLPISRHTTMRPLKENYHIDPIPLNSHATFNWTRLGMNFVRIMQPIDPIMRDLFNATLLDGTGEGGIVPAGVAPMGWDGSWRKIWVQFKRGGAGQWIRPLDLFIYVDMTGTDIGRYHITKVVHNQQVYDSVDDFVAAWKAGELVRYLPDPISPDWAGRKRRDRRRELDEKPGPRLVYPSGARFKVDEQEQWVSWMGWSFYISFERDMGVSLWDVNFLSERIIYQLAPQEAVAQYSGADPHQASTVWLDSAFGMGSSTRDVIEGYDCPEDALLLPATVHEGGSSVRRKAICVFERPAGRPLSRHTGWVKGEMGAVKGFELVVRWVSTVGNYDYIFDYVFQLDGTIEIRVSASGYLQGGLWDPEQDAYGHRISRDGMGSLHDHIINFKVDLDVAGTQNSIMALDLEVEKRDEPWITDGWGPLIQQSLKRTILPTETSLDYPPNAQGGYIVLNQNTTNAWGNARGYIIHPGPLCHLTNLNSTRTARNVEWAKTHLSVTRRKENEGKSSSMFNGNLPGKPAVDFGKFIDGESIVQEDLVVWLNLGTHHIPRAEDSPNTLTNVATTYVSLVPYNYFDEDISMDSMNSVLVSLDQEGKWMADEGVPREGTGGRGHGEKLTWSDMEEYDELGERVPPGQGGETPRLNKMIVG